MKRLLVLACIFVVLPAGSKAQDSTKTVTVTQLQDYKDPTTAQILGLLVPGAGHFYAGDNRGGGLLIGFGWGAPTLAVLYTHSSFIGCVRQPCEHGSTVMTVGFAIQTVATLMSVVTADEAAEHYNEENVFSVHPTGRGVRLTYTF